MGLDAINLILTIEDVFDVKITEDEAGLIPTVGDLHNLVWKKYEDKPSELSAKQRSFELLCSELSSQSDIRGKLFAPDSLTTIYFPKKGRRKQWKVFSKNTGVKLPDLEFSRSIRILIMSICVLFGILVSVWTILSYYQLNNVELIAIILWILVGFVVSVLAAVFSFLLFVFVLLRSPLARNIPASCTTLDGLAGAILAKNPKKFKPFTQNDIGIIIKSILVDEYGFKPEEIKPESRFCEDLGF